MGLFHESRAERIAKIIDKIMDYVYTIQILPKKRKIIVWCPEDKLEQLKEDCKRYLDSLKIPSRGAIFIAYLSF